LASFVLKDPTTSKYISERIENANIQYKTSETLLQGKELAETTSQFIQDIKLMNTVDVDIISDNIKEGKAVNKHLYKEFQKSMSSIYPKKKEYVFV
jgi:tRNA uridine 5-carbamoylmethylation protein Kti12